MDYLKWILMTTEKFPKRVRFTFSDRINDLAIGMVEELLEARYTKNKVGPLARANLRIEKIRVLMRICYEQRFLSRQSYEHSAYGLNEIGKMLGGWLKQQQESGIQRPVK
jgi:hypothetical protein